MPMTRHLQIVVLIVTLLPLAARGFSVRPPFDDAGKDQATTLSGSSAATEPSLVSLNTVQNDVPESGQLLTIRSNWLQAAIRAFWVVGIAEIFDKTWFVALVCALKFGPRMAFCGAYSALLLHTLIAAGLGLGISHLLPVSYLHFITAGVFAVLALLFAREWHAADADSDALGPRKDEVAESQAISGFEAEDPQSSTAVLALFWLCFLPVFVAEWGDRTQIAMIALHSSMPVVPVCAGSALAFLMLTASAVLVARMLEGQQLSERLVLGLSAVSFCIFSLLATIEGIRARNVEMST